MACFVMCDVCIILFTSICRVFIPIRERADNLSLMKHCFFAVFFKLQNNDIITFIKILHDYMEHLFRFLFANKINTIYIFITCSAVLIGNFIFSGLIPPVMNKHDSTDSK